MTDKKPVATKKPTKKRVIKKEPAPAKVAKVELISYSVKMIIPIDDYANIQPEIVVKADRVETAHNYIAPHMNKLWKEYYLVGQRRPEPAPEARPEPAPQPEPAPVQTQTPVAPEEVVKPEVANQPPDSNVALIKATQAIESCLSLEAFDLINDQVEKSVKLTAEDKTTLGPVLEKKYNELFKVANNLK